MKAIDFPEANNDHQQAAHMVKILQKAGYTPKQMTKVLRMARRKFLALKINSPQMMN